MKMRMRQILMIVFVAMLFLGCDDGKETNIYELNREKTYELLRKMDDYADGYRCGIIIQLIFTQEGVETMLRKESMTLTQMDTFSEPVQIHISDDKIKWGDSGLSATLYEGNFIIFPDYDDSGYFRFAKDKNMIKIRKEDNDGNKFTCNVYLKKIQ